MPRPGCEQHRCSPLQDGRRLGPASRTPPLALLESLDRAGPSSQGKGKHRRCRHVSACLTSKPRGTDVGLVYATTPRAVSLSRGFYLVSRRRVRAYGSSIYVNVRLIPSARRLPVNDLRESLQRAIPSGPFERPRPIVDIDVNGEERRNKITRPGSAAKRIAIREYLSERRCVYRVNSRAFRVRKIG